MLARCPEYRNADGRARASAMVALANLTRRGFADGDLSTVMSPRTVVTWAQNTTLFHDPGLAFKLTFLNRCDEDERALVAEYYQRCMGQDLADERPAPGPATRRLGSKAVSGAAVRENDSRPHFPGGERLHTRALGIGCRAATALAQVNARDAERPACGGRSSGGRRAPPRRAASSAPCPAGHASLGHLRSPGTRPARRHRRRLALRCREEPDGASRRGQRRRQVARVRIHERPIGAARKDDARGPGQGGAARATAERM